MEIDSERVKQKMKEKSTLHRGVMGMDNEKPKVC